MNALEQVSALENGKGIQYLLDSAYKIFSSPVYVIDAFYNLIAYSDTPADELFWNELVKTGTFDINALELMANENVVRDVSYSDKIVRLSCDEWKSSLLSGHFFNGDNIWVGEVTMYEYVPFDTEKMAAFEMLLYKISLEIHDYEYFTKQPNVFFENTINKLLDKNVKNTLVNNPQAQIMHYGFERYLNVAVVSVERKNILTHIHRNRLEYFKSMLKTRYQSFRYAVYADKIVMLMGSNNKDFYGASFFTPNTGLFEENGLYMGISGSYENVYETSHYYDQALTALQKGMESSQRVFLFESV